MKYLKIWNNQVEKRVNWFLYILQSRKLLAKKNQPVNYNISRNNNNCLRQLFNHRVSLEINYPWRDKKSSINRCVNLSVLNKSTRRKLQKKNVCIYKKKRSNFNQVRLIFKTPKWEMYTLKIAHTISFNNTLYNKCNRLADFFF